MTSPSETTSPTSASTQIGAIKAYLPIWIAMSITAGLTLGTVATGRFRWLHLPFVSRPAIGKSAGPPAASQGEVFPSATTSAGAARNGPSRIRRLARGRHRNRNSKPTPRSRRLHKYGILPERRRIEERDGEHPVTYDKFDTFCTKLPATSRVIQWGGSRVWKVGSKVFAIGGWAEKDPAFTFKVDEEVYDFLRDQPGLRPAPYFATRGMKWIQQYAKPGLSDKQLREFLSQSHLLASLNLTKKARRELGLDE